MSLPIYQPGNGLAGLQQSFSLMQTGWSQQINPVITQPWNSGLLLKNVALVSGSNTVNHLLAKKLTGWVAVRFHGSWANIYDTQDSNQTPNLTLILVSSGIVIVDLWVF